jgi:lysophospholipid acyltransferase (LPLAT)-like uncharacterized protein
MSGRSGLERLRGTVVSRAGGALITSLLRTGRQEMIHGAEWERDILLAGEPAVYVLWHGRLLPCSFRYRDHGFATLISRNRDGDYITRMIEGWGYRVVRGSSSRGGTSALRSIVRLLREGTSVALTPDGPRGPRQKMKLGPLRAARIAGVPLVPVSAGATAAWYFGGWDRFLVPKPFTWIPVAFGEPLEVPGESTETELDGSAEILEQRLNEITRMVDEAANERRG